NWNGNWLNQYNRSDPNNSDSAINAFEGCTFGLVTGLDTNGNIQYADGVIAPKLFNDGTATGKTFYTDGQFGLQFNRNGDTYTLSAVTGEGNLTGLEYFNNPVTGSTVYNHIWTNNFWPMDGNLGKDGKTGQYQNEGNYVGVGGNKMYPTSDDGLAHNNMFGMQYAVQFKLTEDYTGPLEYYFFGDDDMWVFLDGDLVCDIGGVHSSVGEYVNLWDYVEKGEAGTHTLSFYYTERGLSGSTCYMQFTLPSVSSATPGQSTGALKVEKKVEGQNANTNNDTFTFKLGLTGSNDTPLTNTYPYVIIDKAGQSNIGTISNGGTFELQADESITINNLPTGTKYKVEETNVPDGYIVSHKGGIEEGSTAAVAVGQIETGNTANVTYTNTITPKLPSTGGTGAFRFTFGGITLIALASVMVITGRRRDEHTTA
ncbi:MAG TPA: fibro-slime domain-containing protein, partial [Candidatus Anaerobutyricum stercoripullorum]|nr:fibro-slime domain-containing protein [Candidatus Anaerobutyricum stercoripullorum]